MYIHWKYTLLKWTVHQQPSTKKCIATYIIIQNIREHIHRFTQEQDFINAHLVFLDAYRYFFTRLNKKQTLLGIFDRGANIFLVDFLYNCWSTIVLLRCCGLRCFSSRDCNFLWRYTFLCSTVLYWHACIFRTNVFLFFYTVE